jgi:hypothetical protein
MTHGLYITYKDIFSDNPMPLLSYLSGAGRLNILRIITHYLGLSQKGLRDVEAIVAEFFGSDNQLIRDDILLKISDLRKRHNELVVLNYFSLLKLYEISNASLDETQTLTWPEIEVGLFKAMLIQNESNSDNQMLASVSTSELSPELRLPALLFSQAYPYFEIENFDLISVSIAQLLKSVYLFDFLQNNTSTQEILEEFCRQFKVVNWQEYVNRITPIIQTVLNNPFNGANTLQVNKGESYQDFCVFLDHFIIEQTESVEEDFVSIRRKPFLKINSGEYRIIFKLFAVELIYNGLFFKIKDIAYELQKSTGISNYMSFHRQEFSEKHLLYTVLDHIFSNRYKCFNGEKLRKLSQYGEPDYYVRNGNKVFLFECKDILITKDVKASYDFRKMNNELRKKLFFDDSSGKTKKKAVMQLVSNIELLLSGKYSFDSGVNVRKLQIYPILVLCDRQFNTPGLNTLVNAWFYEEIGKSSLLDNFRRNIRGIVIIDIDTLLIYQDIFRDKILKFDEIIDEYFRFIKNHQNIKKVAKGDLEKIALLKTQSFIPFYEYLATIQQVKKTRPIPKEIRNILKMLQTIEDNR